MERTVLPAHQEVILETVDRNHTFFLLLSHKEVSKLKAIIAGRDLTKLLGAPKEVKMELGTEQYKLTREG
jgi:hypothetical protein